MSFRKGKEANKTFGPWMVYLNKGKTRAGLWENAKTVYKKKTKSWPFSWTSTDSYLDDYPSLRKETFRTLF